MANGTPKAASVYYKDTTTYSGDPGSKTNPYCIEDLYDFDFFVTDPSKSDNNTHSSDYLILVKNIDLNDYDVGYLITGNDTTKYLSFENLDGKGYEIRNISFINNKITTLYTFMKMYDSGKNIHFKNINFLNINYYSANGSLFELYNLNNIKLIFDNCNFTVYNYKRNCNNVNRTYLFDNTSSHTTGYIFNYCTFNIKCALNIKYPYDDNAGIIHYGQFSYCHINFEVMHGFSGLINGCNTFIFSYITITCHYLFQDFKQNISITSGSSDKKTFVGLIEDRNSSTTMSNFLGSYIYLKLIDTLDTEYDPVITYKASNSALGNSYNLASGFANYPNLNNVSGSSFIVLDQEGEKNQVSLYPEPVTDPSIPELKYWNNTIWYVLTKEQAKDPEVLNKIDFPCLPYND